MLTRQIAIAVLLVAVGVAPVAAVGTQQAQGYAGTHVAFDASDGALVDYAVNGQTVFEEVKVQSANRVDGGLDVGADVSAVSGFSGAGLTLSSQTAVRATVSSNSGAQLVSHDNSRGILVVRAGGSSQYVSANLSEGVEPAQESESRVVVTHEDGSRGVFLVVGNGEVTVNDRGNVTARLDSNGRLVYRSYPEGRSDDDQQQEQLIMNGQAAAEVYIVAAGEEGSEQTADVVSYTEDTTVEVTEQSEGTLRMTAQRSQQEGRVIICTVSQQAFDSVQDVNVTVDGEAATRVSSYGELESAAQGGDNSAYMVRQQSSAEASGEVLVGVNHFSTREVTVSDDGDGNGGTDGFGPGFGIMAAIAALIGLSGALLAGRRL